MPKGKKVAIVGITTGSLAGYFMQQCNAARAKEFAIATSDSADSQQEFHLSPTLVTGKLVVSGSPVPFEWAILDSRSKVVLRGIGKSATCVIAAGRLIPGVYFLRLTTLNTGMNSHAKFIKQ